MSVLHRGALNVSIPQDTLIFKDSHKSTYLPRTASQNYVHTAITSILSYRTSLFVRTLPWQTVTVVKKSFPPPAAFPTVFTAKSLWLGYLCVCSPHLILWLQNCRHCQSHSDFPLRHRIPLRHQIVASSTSFAHSSDELLDELSRPCVRVFI